MRQELLDLVERFDPGYSRRIQGATSEDIQSLEQLVGRSLPACYREFLALMGKNMAKLGVEEVYFGIDRIVDFYSNGHWVPPANYILFGIQDEDPYFDYYLDCTKTKEGDCPVVRFPREGEFSKTSTSIRSTPLSEIFSSPLHSPRNAWKYLTTSACSLHPPVILSSPGLSLFVRKLSV